MKISIFGSWYVGLVTWACLAELGHDVLCIDIDIQKIEKLKNGIIPIYEPWLEELVKKNVAAERLNFDTNIEHGIEFWKVIFSWVWTPPDKDNNNKANLTYVFQVAKSFWENIKEYKIFVNKSTVPVWTGKKCFDIIKREIYKRNMDTEFDVVSNPEFLKEWSAIKDFLSPDRIVIGSESSKAREIMDEVYKPLKKNATELGFTEIIHTNIASAEIIKYAANSFLATKISFINEIANFCELTWGHIDDVALWIGSDRRIWKSFLNAWVWYGWSCFPKDLQAFIETGKELAYDFSIIKSTHEVNEKQKLLCFEKLKKHFENLEWKKVALWGLSFKANTDDIRNAPSLATIDELLKTNIWEIRVYDPIALPNVKQLYSTPKIFFGKTAYEVVEWADALILFTEWDEFKIPNLKLLKKLMNGKLIIDGRNLWEKEDIIENEFTYEGIGKTQK